MERWERERIMREGGVGAANPLDEAAARRLEEDLVESVLYGRPLPQRLRNFRPAVDRYVVSLGGVPAHLRRLREIEDEANAHRHELDGVWRALAEECSGDAEGFAERWRDRAKRWSFHSINDLIERHNRYYPAEARLPMDPRSGDFVPVAGESYRRQPLDAGWILEQFPPELSRAAAEDAAAAA